MGGLVGVDRVARAARGGLLAVCLWPAQRFGHRPGTAYPVHSTTWCTLDSASFLGRSGLCILPVAGSVRTPKRRQPEDPRSAVVQAARRRAHTFVVDGEQEDIDEVRGWQNACQASWLPCDRCWGA